MTSAGEYAAAGVDLAGADEAKARIAVAVAGTRTALSVGKVGAFGGMVRVPAGKRRFVDDLSQATEFRDKHVFQGWLILMYLGRGNAGRIQPLIQEVFGFFRFVHQQIEAVAET